MLPFLLIALVGVFLLVRGLRPRRRGSTPFCRKCGYNLTGLDRYPATHGERPCPECGLDLTLVDSTVIGKRVRRPLLAGFGLLLVVVGGWPFGLAGVAAMQGVAWYSKMPTWWVLSDLGDDDEKVARRAWSEIQSRHQAGTLSAGQLSSLIDACLDEQARPELRIGIGVEMINMLGDPAIESAMTAAQIRRYANNLARNLTLSIRPRVIAGEQFRIWFNADHRVPRDPRGSMSPLHLISFTCNGVEIEGSARIGGTSGCSTGSTGIPHELADPGKAVFKAVVRAELYHGVYDPRQLGSPALASDPIELTAVTEVLPAGATDEVKLIRSDAIDKTVSAAVFFKGYVLASTKKSDAFSVGGQIEFGPPPPCNLAFDVVVEFADVSLTIATIKVRRESTVDSYHFQNVGYISGTPETIDIVLRASPDAARDTPDIFEIWGGSLRFNEVAMIRSIPMSYPRVRAVLEED